MRRALQLLSILLFLAPFSRANQNAQGWCETGNQPVVTSGLTSTTKVQASYPSCTVTVFIHGGGLATIYSDNINTPLANPFAAASNGRWLLYAANGRYDVQLSGAGFPSPVTYSDILLNDISALASVTGSPVSGNLAKFSGAATLTNGDLSGDVTTTGTLATTLATVATPGTSTKVTYNAKGLVTSGVSAVLASSDFVNQGTTSTVLHGNAAGNPSFGTVALASEVSGTLPGANMAAVNLASGGNGGVTGSLPVATVASGTNGQCINTSGGVTTWGSCAGTAGEQLLSVNTTPVTVNASVTTAQTLQAAQSPISAGALNTLGKSIRIVSAGVFNPVNNSETIIFAFTPGGGGNAVFASYVATTNGSNIAWSITSQCTTTTTGASGVLTCIASLAIGPIVAGVAAPTFNSGLTASGGTFSTVNLTGTLTPAFFVTFNSASASNTAAGNYLMVEQLN